MKSASLKIYLFLTAVTLLCLVSYKAEGNGFGIKLDQTVGEYIINVDADAYTFVAGEQTNFIFQLWNKDRSEKLEFDNAWVSITPAGSFANVFGAFLGKPDFGGYRATMVFPRPGTYDLLIRMGKNGAMFSEPIAEATFPITVEKGLDMPGYSRGRDLGIAGFLGVVAGVLMILYLKKR